VQVTVIVHRHNVNMCKYAVQQGVHLSVLRYSSVYRQAQSVTGQSMQSKLDAARDEVEDCVAKVDQTRVSVLAD